MKKIIMILLLVIVAGKTAPFAHVQFHSDTHSYVAEADHNGVYSIAVSPGIWDISDAGGKRQAVIENTDIQWIGDGRRIEFLHEAIENLRKITRGE